MSDGAGRGDAAGWPLSPLLSNIHLTPYDKELERRGHKFVRYADDCNIFTRSKYACRRVRDSVVRFLEGRMKLKVNMEKTEARRAVGSSFLGFTFITTKSRDGLGMCKPKAKKVAGFGLNDKVMYAGQLCCIHGRRSSGYFDIRRLDGTRVHAGIHYRHLTLVERATTNLIYKELVELPPSGRA